MLPVDFILSVDTTCEVQIQITSKVAYAYLWNQTHITSDVWLFNGPGQVSEQSEWLLPDVISRLPFLNPSGLCKPESVRFYGPEGVDAVISQDGAAVEIFYDHMLFAVLGLNLKPGYCCNAAQSGPLALPLEEYRGRDSSNENRT